MKNFRFALTGVMEWRRTRVQIEEAALERLYGELRGLEAASAQLYAQEAVSEGAVFAANSVTGADLWALADLKLWVKKERARLQQASAACQKRIGEQLKTVVERRRDLHLLEKLRERQLASWKLEMEREVDQQAEELNLRKLARRS